MRRIKNAKAHHHPVKIMGCAFVITAIQQDPQIAWDAIRAGESEMTRVEALISSWQSTSQTHQINEAAGKHAVEVDTELFELIRRSIKISDLTAGAFDISGTLARFYWKFDKSINKMLPKSKIQELNRLVDYRNIHLNPENNSVFLARAGMKIGFGGIGKGYAAQRAKKVMQEMGIENGLVNASGDLLSWGSPPDKDSWEVAIPDPRDRRYNLLSINLHEGSVVTSGSFESYSLIDGTRYSHIINPRTGMPVTHTQNVTVICPDAEFADAYATALSVLPIEQGINLSNQLNGVECIIIDANDQAHISNQLKTRAYA